MVNELLKLYEKRKDEILKKLKEFKKKIDENDKTVFAELAFCICTPQSRATEAWNAIKALSKNGLLYKGSAEQISQFLKTVRFGKNKARYIVEARKKFMAGRKIRIKQHILSFNNPFDLREFLVKNVRGLGMKESSHFIRNIGLSKNQIAILDVHILRNLKHYNVIRKIPEVLTRKKYLEIEKKMKEFSGRIGIPMDELDLLFWSKETGIIFK